MQKGHVESVNGRLRDECLNANWFRNRFDARHKIAVWRDDYNDARPHSSLAYRTPGEFAAQRQRPSSSFHSVPQPEPAVKATLTARLRTALTDPAAANHLDMGTKGFPDSILT
jgi:hypothetical protein